MNKSAQTDTPLIGLLMLETTFPRIPGDIGNPESFTFPLRYKLVKGASPKRVVKEADPTLLEPFIAAARELEQEGVKVISTSCGFLAIFQKELARAVKVPVLTSSLMQVHLAQELLKPGQKVGVLTASQESLTRRHLEGVGIADSPLAVAGMDAMPEFRSVFIGGKSELDLERCRQEMLQVTRILLRDHPEIAVLVLECTNMPPYAGHLRKAFGLPVFDALTMLNHLHQSLTAGLSQGYPPTPRG